MDWGQTILFIGGSAGFTALVVEAFRAIKNRKRERFELEEAISKAPIIRQSLDLGNFDVAIKNLLAINTSQAAHIDRQDKRIKALETEAKDLRTRNSHLEEEDEKNKDRIAHLEGIIERRRKPR
jgi:peptidoglycan hydrolase CwlO-like protein